MDRRTVSDPALAREGKFQGLIDRNSSFRQSAFGHNLGRNVRVVQVLSYLALLKQNGVPLTGAVECVAAGLQNFSSSKTMLHMGLPTEPRQAAHFLPGQIRIGGKEVWRFAANPATRGPMEFLFAEVEHLPVPFNQADSAAEASQQPDGLCSAFAQGCAAVIRKPMLTRGIAGKVDMALLQEGYAVWHRGAVTAIGHAIARKRAAPGIPPLVGDPFAGYTPESIEARSGAPASQWNREGALSVLEYYAEDQQQRGWTWVVGQGQSTVRDVETRFKG